MSMIPRRAWQMGTTIVVGGMLFFGAGGVCQAGRWDAVLDFFRSSAKAGRYADDAADVARGLGKSSSLVNDPAEAVTGRVVKGGSSLQRNAMQSDVAANSESIKHQEGEPSNPLLIISLFLLGGAVYLFCLDRRLSGKRSR
jgi:hypothetical protein